MTTITTTIPFKIRTGAGLKSFSVGTNPADEQDIAHPFVARLAKAEVLTIAVDAAETLTVNEVQAEGASKATKSRAKA